MDETVRVQHGDVQTLAQGRFFCSLCHVEAPNKSTLDEHIKGKKHKHRSQLRSSRFEQEERSVFVGGFKKGVVEDQLSNYFKGFGPVDAVIMDKDKGAYAIVRLADVESARRVLAAGEHHLDGKHLCVKPREHKDFQCPSSSQRPVIGPTSLEHLRPLLMQQESVDEQMIKLVEVLELQESEKHLRCLLVCLLQEVFCEFFPGCVVSAFGSSVNGFGLRGCDMDLLLDLDTCSSFQGRKTETLGKPMKKKEKQPSPDDLEETEKEDCKWEERENHTAENMDEETEDCGSVDSLLSDMELAGASPAELLELVVAVLRKCVPGVHKVQAVPSARLPVVKFTHRDSGVRCDISVNNRLALHNTKFLHFCTDLDERIRPLVYVIRYWAKQKQLAGNPFGGGPLLNNYALTLLLLHFLQQTDPPVLPSLRHLRNLAGKEQCIVDGHDCTFVADTTKVERSKNTDELRVLLSGFFKFYGDFEFTNMVISLEDGTALPRTSFKGGGSDESQLPLRFSIITLQDPFETFHNVAGNVNERAARRFRRECDAAAKYCRSLQYQRKSAKGKTWGVTRLFTAPSENEASPLGSPAGTSADTDTIIEVPIKAEALQIKGETGAAKDLHARLFSTLHLCLCKIFTHVLHCECQITSLRKEGKSLQHEASSVTGEDQSSNPFEPHEVTETCADPPSGMKRKQTANDDKNRAKRPRPDTSNSETEWYCTVPGAIWLGRRKIKRQLKSKSIGGPAEEAQDEGSMLEEGKRAGGSSGLDLPESLQEEARITEKLMLNRSAVRPQLTFVLSLKLLNDERAGPKAVMCLKAVLDENNHAQDFFHFLSYFLPPQLDKVLGEQKQHIEGRVIWSETKLMIGNQAVGEEERFDV
uniref:Speckle targeted PIP5K1A-regulated poly(A) polymerase n=1 Tax=Eptatretus burgeri TaxID=7764 RepID=A0A8C4R214_EPTBU